MDRSAGPSDDAAVATHAYTHAEESAARQWFASMLTAEQEVRVRQRLGPELAVFMAADMWSDKTYSNYKSSWRQWSAYAQQCGVDSLAADAQHVANFLVQMHRAGYATASVQSARAAIGSISNAVGGAVDTQAPIVARTMAIIARKQPKQPKYNEFWDPALVTAAVLQAGDNDTMPLHELQLKSVVLLALSSCMRASDIFRIRDSSVACHPTTGDLTAEIAGPKESREHHNVRIFIEALRPAVGQPAGATPPRPPLCPVSALMTFRRRRDSEWPAAAVLAARERVADTIFRGARPPHRPLTSKDTIANWLLQYLARAGIDTCRYGAHSYRGASATDALRRGVPIGDVMLVGRWTSRSVFETFYRRAQPLFSVVQAVLGDQRRVPQVQARQNDEHPEDTVIAALATGQPRYQ